MTTEDAKTYLSKREIPRLFESLMTGLMFHRPTDHIQYLIDCLEKAKNNGQVTWNMFVEFKRQTPLPPITPENGRRPSSRGRRSATPKEEPKALEESRGTPLPPIGGVFEKAKVEGLPDVPFVLVMGGPGCGKNTQIQKLLAHHDGWLHVSMGDLIRQEVAHKSSADKKWKMVNDLMSRGEMASEDDARELFIDQLKKNQTAKGFIIEGYPRNMSQLEDYEKNVGRADLVILIDCEERYLSQRLLKRGAANNRIDDNIQAVSKRLQFFKDKTLPVIKYFDDQDKVKIFEGDEDEDVLSQEIISVFDNVIYGKEIKPAQPKVPVPPSEPKPARQRSAKTKTPEPDTSEVKELDVPDLPTFSEDMLPAEVKVKDEGRKSGMPECPIIFLAGGPGSGKGTQCKKIVERYSDVVHLSMGDILRTEISTKGTADDKWGMISTLLTEGDMAPEDVTIDLLIANIKKHPDARAFVIEGYPRDLNQLEEFNKHIGGLNFAILLDCEEYYLQERLINRGASSGRPDDNLSAIGKRIAFFKRNSLPILKHFDDEGKLVVVMGDRDDQEIFYEISQTLDFALFGRKTEVVEAVPPQTGDSAPEEEVKATDAGQEESTPQAETQEESPEQGLKDGEGQEEAKEPVIEEEMVAETATGTGGDGGNKQYSAELDAAAANAEKNDEQEADAQKEDGEKTDEQETEAKKEDEEKSEAQQAEAQQADVQEADDQKADAQEADAQKADDQQADAQQADDQKADDQKADDQKEDDQKADAQQEDAQKEDDQQAEDQQQDKHQAVDAVQSVKDVSQGQQDPENATEGQKEDTEGQKNEGDEAVGQTESDNKKEEAEAETQEATKDDGKTEQEEKEDDKKEES